jgi:predicted DNA-binding transcriptional regulator YafY
MASKIIYERFIWFDNQVRGKKYPNAFKLAEKFEISPKTAQRDIEFMRDRLHCPLKYDLSQKGYFYKDGTFSLPMIYLSPAELSSLLIARKLLRDVSHGTWARLNSVMEKITNAWTDTVWECRLQHLVP